MTAKPDISVDDLYYTTKHLMLVLHRSKQSVYQLIKQDGFPEPVTLTDGSRDYLWLSEEVHAWVRNQPRGLREKRTVVTSHMLETKTVPDVRPCVVKRRPSRPRPERAA